MFLFIDNYDSFSWNLVQAFYALGRKPVVHANDDPRILELATSPELEAVCISPGPSHPRNAGLCLEFLKRLPASVPVLGVCLGHQLLGYFAGAEVSRAPYVMHGKSSDIIHDGAGLFSGLPNPMTVGRYHSLVVQSKEDEPNPRFTVTSRGPEGEVMALRYNDRPWVGIQFHPEVTHSHEGRTILRNFLSCAANLKKFDIGDFKRELIREIRERVGDKQVVCGVSGGVDSTVLAVLLHEAGVNMRAIFVDNGLLRKNEAEEVRANFARMNVEIETVDASERFLAALAGESDPEKKRRIIGGLFIDVFWDAVGDAEMLAQGTLYPDVIESASNAKSKASVIKTHHNRVERVLELQAQGKVLEPLAELFKDEVRELGASMGIPHDILWRHPFPGPGLAVRCPGVVTKERLDIIRECDAIFIGNLKKYGWYDKVWQAYAGLIPVKTVGVKGDERSYEWATNLRAIVSEDAMTADWVELPPALLRETSNRILNEVKGINRVLYDISTKPPASIEWE